MTRERWLRISLGLGAGYDAVVALALFLAPGWLARLLRLDPPEAIYLRLIGVLLLIAAAFYLLAARSAALRQPGAWIAGVGRLLGGLVLLQELNRSARPAFALLGAADLAFALLLATGLIFAPRPSDK